MSTEIQKQIEEFSKSISAALDMFKGQDALVKVLQAKIADLEAKALERVPMLVPQRELGFTDAKVAKEFVSMVKGIFAKDDDRVKDMVEGRDPDGGYLVRPEYRNTLLSIMELYGLARQRCTVIPMNSSELIMPKLTGGVQVYWVGEGQTIPTTQPTFGEFRMTVKKLAALVPMTSELLDDASISIANLLGTLFGQAMAREEDRVVFTGNAATGGDPFDGVLYTPGVKNFVMPAGNTGFANVTADMLSDVIAGQPAALSDGAQWYFHRTVLGTFRKMKNADGDYIWSSPSADGQPGMIWGYPYTLCELMPNAAQSGPGKPFMFFGNLKHYYIGDRKQMTIARSEHVGFAQDKVFLRVLQREALAYAIPETGVVLKTSTT